MNRPLACALSALMLQACTTPVVAPSASLDLPSTWQGQEQGQAGSLRVQSEWWRGLHDPVLDALVAEALLRNPDLRQATARLAEARAMTAAERGAEWPSVRAVEAGNRSKAISDVTLEPYLSNNQQLEVQASYELDLWGRVRDLSTAARRSEDAVRQTRDAVALSVAASVASAYVGLRAIDAQLELAHRTADSRAHSLAITHARQQVGYGSSLESAQADAELRATTQAIPQLELARKRQEQSLMVLLGRTRGSIERGLSLLQLVPQPLPTAGLPSELLRRRPDIASAESQVAAADAQWAAARARLLPSINLTASLGQVSSSILHGDPFSIWSVGGSVLAPIFNGGALRSLAAASSARRDEALIGYQKVVLTSLSEVETQLAVFEKSQEQLSQAELQSAALAESLRIARRRYVEGYSSYLDQLLSERSLFAVQQGILQLHADTLVAQISVYRALGGGWDADAAGKTGSM